ncbi:MAG: DUF4349 domain-containing protein [Syntrophobacteraceae bacterium]
MNTRRCSITILLCLLLTFGCSQSEKPQRPIGYHENSPGIDMPAPSSRAPSQDANNQSAESHRFIAIRHNIFVETSETELQKAYESIREFCQTIHCEITASSIRRNSDSPPFASISLRIAPEEAKRLIEQVGKAGKVVEHRTASEDKTSTVIDVQAKIQNLIELRDRLRKLLASPAGSLKDVVEVERELSRAQSELDSLQMRRKALANETEKIAVDISFSSRKSVAGTGAFSPVAKAWHGAGHVFAESIAFAITFIVAILPWLVLFIPTLWLLLKGLKKLRRKRIASHGSAKAADEVQDV